VTAWAVRIHDPSPRGYKPADLHDVLAALGATIAGCKWVIQDLECAGDAAELAVLVEHNREAGGVVLTTKDLLGWCSRMGQVIDAILLAFNSDVDADLRQLAMRGEDFAGSGAVLKVLAADNSVLVVAGTDVRMRYLLRCRFKDVSDCDPAAA